MAGEKTRLLTTGQAAELCSVKPDTVRKWIKRGHLLAAQTAGGHYRVEWQALTPFITKGNDPGSGEQAGCALPLRCWEYLSERGTVSEDCRDCVVFRVRAARCFMMAELEGEIGFVGKFCGDNCADCLYYQRITAGMTNVLVIAREREALVADRGDLAEGIQLRFAANGYQASAIINDFRPSFVVVDEKTAQVEEPRLLASLASDPRLFGLKIIIARPPSAQKRERLQRFVSAAVEKPFTVAELLSVVEDFPVELAADEQQDPTSASRRA